MIASLLLTLAAASTATPAPASGLMAIRARRVETVANGTLEHAVILIEDGKIVKVGEDLPIERGIPVFDVPEGWIVLPGLVNCSTRAGMEGDGYDSSRPDVHASSELLPANPDYAKLLEAGITTLANVPQGSGIPGQSVVVRPSGEAREEMILLDEAYLMIHLRSTPGSKKMIREGFKKADDFLEKEQKNREKWEKDQEKKKKKKKSSKKADDEDEDKKNGDDDKDGADKDSADEDDDVYHPLEPDPEVAPFLRLRDGTLRALISIGSAGDYEHLLDAIDDEEFSWDLRIPLTRFSNVFYIMDKIAERGCRVVFEPSISLQPHTMRQRSLPMEFADAGVKIVFVPRRDSSIESHETWRVNVGELVGAGLDRQTALRAMTLEPAELLGLGDRVGSIEVGKHANLLMVDGDPFEPSSRVKVVVLDGEIVFGEVNL